MRTAVLAAALAFRARAHADALLLPAAARRVAGVVLGLLDRRRDHEDLGDW